MEVVRELAKWGLKCIPLPECNDEFFKFNNEPSTLFEYGYFVKYVINNRVWLAHSKQELELIDPVAVDEVAWCRDYEDFNFFDLWSD